MNDGVNVQHRPSREEEFHSRTNTFYQFRALFLKDLTLQWRSWKTNVCQLLTPVIFIVFAGLMQVIVNIILVKHKARIPGTEVPFPPINVGKMLSCDFNGSVDDSPHMPTECYRYVLNFYGEVDVGRLLGNFSVSDKKIEFLLETLVGLEEEAMEPCQKMLYDLPFYYIGGDVDMEELIGNLTVVAGNKASRSGLVGRMVPDRNFFDFSLDFDIDYNDSELSCPIVDGGPTLAVPAFWHIDNRTELNKHLGQVVKQYNAWANLSTTSRDQYERTYSVNPLSQDQYRHVMEQVKNKSLERLKPQGAIFFDKYDKNGSSVNIHYTMEADELALYKLVFSIPKLINTSKVEVDVHRRNMFVNMVDNAIFKDLLGESGGGEDPLISTYIMPIPVEDPLNITIDIASILGGILYPFAYSFLIPVFMASIVKDKHEKHLIMMEQNGLSRWTYWLVTYTFNFILYIPIALEIGILSIIFKFRLFTQTNGLVLFVTFFLWGHAEVVLGFFLSNFFSRPRTATIVGYLLVIAGIIIALLLEALQIFPPDKTPFALYMIYPPFAFYRILFYCINACISMRCFDVSILSAQGGLNLVTTALLYLGLSTVVLFIVSVYLSYVLPGEYGVRKSPFFPIIDSFKFIRSLWKKHISSTRRTMELDKSPPHTGVDIDEEDVDVDVQDEEDMIGQHFPDNAPVVLYRLRKDYPSPSGGPPYVAVHSVSVAIEKNECFGLLGPNGAGKTTLISVLTGLYEPTSGKARIAGYDLATEIDAIHHHLGVCPQFDIHHAELTAEEHLYFYARLKGAKWSKEKAVVERALRQVNLYDARKCKSKNLSGGMRRRLSVAMACIGNPDILILDEPTTGLDPASRRQVWEVIETVKEGRSVILTTHAMEEADHLCTRIGIMNFGKLRCLGTQTRLKTRFGTGYQISFNCAPGRVREVENFVQTNIPYVVHTETYSNTCSFKLDKENLKVCELFTLLNSEKTRLGILDWGVKMTTLEDVFLKIVKTHSDHRVQDGRYCLPAWVPFSSYCKLPVTGNEE